jgi:GT2 family glycosyltransferase
MLLSVVVVNWNSKEHLAACLSALEKQTHRELQVIVVDNGSEDGSAELVAERFPQVTLIRAGENLGFAEGCNRGLALAQGPWVAMLNNDAFAEPEWAAALVRAAESAAPHVGTLQSLMLFQSRPGIVNSTGVELLWNGTGCDRSEGKTQSECSASAEIFCACAGAAAYRRTMLEQIKLTNGYFDRTHFMYLEDLDLGWRAQLAGWTAEYVPDSVVQHVWHGSSSRHGNSWLAGMVRANRIRTVLKNASPAMLARTGVNLLGAAIELIWYARGRGPQALFGAVRAGLQGRREVSAFSRRDRREVEAKWLKSRRS